MSLPDDDNVVPLAPDVREPPHNTEVEAALLGAILTNNRTFEQVAGALEPHHFYDALHGRIFMACADLIDAGKVASPITLHHKFENDPDLEDVGGASYLGELQAGFYDVTGARHYAETLVSLHNAREALGVVAAASASLNENGDESRTIIEGAIESLSRLAEGDGAGGGLRSLADVLDDTLQEIDRDRKGETPAGISTGLSALDGILSMMPGDMTVMGARPAMGKTTLCLNIAEHCARTHGPTAVFQLEMRDLQLARRELARGSGVAVDRMAGRRARDLDQDDFDAIVNAARRCRDLPLFIDDTPAISVGAVLARAKRFKRRHGALALIVVDYIQLMRPSAEARRQGRVSEITEISSGLKGVAKSLDTHMLALSQLSRQVENRENKRPMLSDLRDSGSIEQDADNVLFPYRQEYYLERELQRTERGHGGENFSTWNKAESTLAGSRGLAELIVAKQRQGRTGSCSVHFDGESQRFYDIAKDNSGEDLL